MTEDRIFFIQESIYSSLIQIFNQEQITPMMQKIIIEGIYARFANTALEYQVYLKNNNTSDINTSKEQSSE